MASKKNIIPYLAAVAGPALITALALPVRDQLGNAATIALVQIFVVVLVAIRWGSGPALVAAVSAMIIFNFFFLEPYYTFVISGYDDIVFYLAFVAISLAVGNLSAQAKRRADLAESRLGEIERLYADLQQESRERARVEEEVRRLNEELQEKIVQLQEAQEALRQESEAKYRSLVNNIPDAIWSSDDSGKTVFISPAFERMSGYTVAEVYAGGEEFWFGGIHPDDQELVTKAFEGLLARHSLFDIEYRFRKKDGTWIWLHDRAVTTYQKNGVSYADGLFSDVTSRKQAEEALQRSRDFCLTLFDGFPTPIWRAGLDKKCNYFNQTWLEFTGRRMEQELGNGWAEGVHPDDLERCLAGYQQAFDQRAPFQLEYRLRHHSGEYRWLIDFGRPFYDLEGEFAGYIGSCYDVTESRRADEKIRRLNAELEQKVEERTRQLVAAQEELVRKEKLSILGQLSGSVGHELRNPLGIMSNAVYFLRMVLADADETTREYLGIIENEIANSQRIITDLLDFARTKPPQRQRIAPVALVRQSLPRCTIPRNVMLHVEVPEELPKLHVDPLQLGEVLMNLITNAVQAMPEGGDLTITGEAVDTMLRLAVRDSGTGITPEHMAKLFQPLFTTKPRGIGLGLVVCKNLVGANGGRIEVASEVGQGTTFSVVLPAEGP